MLSDKQFKNIYNINVKKQKILIPPEILIKEIPILQKSYEIIKKSRKEIAKATHGKDDRVVLVVGPCSIHDTNAATAYGSKLKDQIKKFENEIIIVMRVYFEKPRTTIGWKGLINDPNLDDSFCINKGLRLARTLLSDLTHMGLPCATEFLDVITPQYFAEFISWGAIGARTVESQVHRELASGLSATIGFKNTTNGNIQVAIDAIKSATFSHHFLSTTRSGTAKIFETKGNKNTHIILRGGNSKPNFSRYNVNNSINTLEKSAIYTKVMVDCSHDNSQKDHSKQINVLNNICQQISTSKDIFGVMIESNLLSGNQSFNKKPLEYGKSITDACVDFDETIKMMEMLAKAVQARRNSQ